MMLTVLSTCNIAAQAGPTAHDRQSTSDNTAESASDSSQKAPGNSQRKWDAADVERVHNLAYLEFLLNAIAIGMEIVGISMGGNFLIAGIILLCKSKAKAGVI